MLNTIAAIMTVAAAVAVAVVWKKGLGAPPTDPAAVPDPDRVLVGSGGLVESDPDLAPEAVSRAAAASKPAPTDPVGRLVDALRRRKGARIALSVVSAALAVAAVAMLGYPVYTNFYADRRQAELERQLASADLEAAYREGRVGEGDSLTRIVIPRIDVDVIVVEGVGGSALRAGAGHYPKTALPCETGNVGIAGHRTTYGRPFHNLDRLSIGDTIVLETPIGTCTYEISEDPFIVLPNDTSVVAETPGEAVLTLTTCHPKGSARQRLIVRAQLVTAGAPGDKA